MRYFKVAHMISTHRQISKIICEELVLDESWAVFTSKKKDSELNSIILAVPREGIIDISETDKDFLFLPV